MRLLCGGGAVDSWWMKGERAAGGANEVSTAKRTGSEATRERSE